MWAFAVTDRFKTQTVLHDRMAVSVVATSDSRPLSYVGTVLLKAASPPGVIDHVEVLEWIYGRFPRPK